MQQRSARSKQRVVTSDAPLTLLHEFRLNISFLHFRVSLLNNECIINIYSDSYRYNLSKTSITLSNWQSKLYVVPRKGLILCVQ